jgi:hypothetical protein
MENNGEAKQAAIEHLHRFGPHFEWKPEQESASAALLANAMNDLFRRFGLAYHING